MLTVLGAGAWGSALAISAARDGAPVTLWGRNAEAVQAAARDREIANYLPGVRLPDSLRPEADLATAVAGADAILVATPSSAFPAMLDAIAAARPLLPPVAWACKGFERGSGRLLSDVFASRFGAAHAVAVVSGPTFAREVAEALPTAVAVAASSPAFGDWLRRAFHSRAFRVYVNDDLPGVQVGGAVKNVIAIAVGMSDGLGFGANSRAALIARGLAEMSRLGGVFGARRETLMGLAGLGDLVLTSTDDQSRNRRFGLALGRGLTPRQASIELGALVEGAQCALEVQRLAARHALDLPIMNAVADVVVGTVNASAAGQRLMSREPGDEI